MNRSERRRAAGRGRTATAVLSTAAAVTAAVALTTAVSPPASPPVRNLDVALAAQWGPYPCGDTTCYGYPAFTTGPLLSALTPIANLAGLNPLNLLGVGYNLDYKSGAKSIYNAINSLPYGPVEDIPNYTCRFADEDFCRTSFQFATGFGAFGLSEAIKALRSSAGGDTPDGYQPLTPVGSTPGGPPSDPRSGLTQASPFYINNVLRPDGGLATRFGGLFNLFGQQTDMPNVGFVGPTETDAMFFNWASDITWPYNTLADFPVTANPIALLNTMFAGLPPVSVIQQVLGGGNPLDLLETTGGSAYTKDYRLVLSLPPQEQCPIKCSGQTFVGYGGVLLGTALGGAVFPGDNLAGVYATLDAVKTALPIMAPTYILSSLVNPLLKAVKSPYLLGTPLADVLTPAMKILINIAYNDVLTPGKLNQIADPLNNLTFAQEGYQAYDRTFWQTTNGKPVPFGWFNNPAMTAEETTAAYGDAWKAFTGALQAQAQKPLLGLLVPNPDNPPKAANTAPAATKAAAAQTVSAPTPAVQAAPVSAPEPTAPVVSQPEPAAPAPVAAEKPSAPVALSAIADDEPGAPTAPAAPAHRGRATSSATPGDSGGGAGQGAGNSGGGHRGAHSE